MLLDDAALERSSVVASNATNRERSLKSYTRELGLDIVAAAPARRLDLCCGSGRALFDDGRFVADFDVRGVRAPGRVSTRLREQGFEYDTRWRRISLTGRRDVRLPYRYLGADDQVGANYTGQAAVGSHYG
ncbi:hypothetical protein ACGFNU_09735 [Spirillospora sp. NPDC048911]|uniref:hypothetical protein n=1 Tax=Spirillospora sp. NPDC048911 TaxID=3364527 RepID=UPI00371BB4CF